MKKRLSYFIRAEGQDREAVRKGLDWLVQVSITKGHIAVAGLRNFDGLIGEELGKAAVRDLKFAGKTLILGKDIYIVTKLRPLRDADNAPVVAFYPYGKFLDSLDSIRNVMALLVVPWNMQEIETWVRTWDAKELGVKSNKGGPRFAVNRILEEALRDLVGRVNRSAGMENPVDRDAAAQLFVILREGGETYSPDEIKAWLVSEAGWRATHAREVAEVAAEVLLGNRSGRGNLAWPSDALRTWRTRSAQRQRRPSTSSAAP
ncbi:MAG: hypothetical protein ACUVT7_00620 [Thermoplasmata archaeon]